MSFYVRISYHLRKIKFQHEKKFQMGLLKKFLFGLVFLKVSVKCKQAKSHSFEKTFHSQQYTKPLNRTNQLFHEDPRITYNVVWLENENTSAFARLSISARRSGIGKVQKHAKAYRKEPHNWVGSSWNSYEENFARLKVYKLQPEVSV